MKFFAYQMAATHGLAVETDGGFRGMGATDAGFPGDLAALLGQGGDALERAARILAQGDAVDPATARFLPPIPRPGKILCVGLNYRDHAAESGFEPPSYPTLFARFATSLVAHGAPMLRPEVSEQLDYEGELVAVIGRAARDVPEAQALDHVAGYSIFNDGSVRDYQFKAPQWTAGKNFDATGGFGPYFVTADTLPPGCRGLRLTTRLNGRTVQDGSIDDMIFPVARLVSICSQVMTLEPGDIIVTGTPAGVGQSRKPPLFMKDGDLCEVEIDGIGTLVNPVRDRAPGPA